MPSVHTIFLALTQLLLVSPQEQTFSIEIAPLSGASRSLIQRPFGLITNSTNPIPIGNGATARLIEQYALYSVLQIFDRNGTVVCSGPCPNGPDYQYSCTRDTECAHAGIDARCLQVYLDNEGSPRPSQPQTKPASSGGVLLTLSGVLMNSSLGQRLFGRHSTAPRSTEAPLCTSGFNPCATTINTSGTPVLLGTHAGQNITASFGQFGDSAPAVQLKSSYATSYTICTDTTNNYYDCIETGVHPVTPTDALLVGCWADGQGK